MSDKTYTITGRRFSKVIHWNESSTQQEIDETGGFCTAAGAIEFWKEKAVSILKEKNLPYSALVYYTPGTKQWQIEPPLENNKSFMPYCFIHFYILQERKYQPDSIEGLAARILVIADHYKNKRMDSFMLGYELGKIEKLIHVENVLSNAMLKIRKPAEPKRPFTDLAKILVNNYKGINNTEYWDILKNDNHEDYEISLFENKECLFYSKPDGKILRISKKTFIRNSIPEARKK